MAGENKPSSTVGINETEPKPASGKGGESKTGEIVRETADGVGMVATAQTGVDAAVKAGTTVAQDVAVVGEKMAEAWEKANLVGAIATAGVSIANYKAGNISGGHLAYQLATSVVSYLVPGAGFLMGLVDVSAGEYIFDDPKK